MKILKENKILNSLKESEDVKGLTIKEVAEKLFDGYLDMDVTDVDIDVLVAFVYEVGKQPEDSYDRFIDIMANRTKVVELNGDILVCDFTSVFKPYEKELQDFFDMDNSEFSEAYYEAVDNLEGLLSGFTGESTYKELCDILEGNKTEEVMNESDDDSDEIINPQDEAFANSIYDVYLWCGSGYALNKFRVFGICAEDALDITVAYCEKESMSGLIYTMDEIEKDVEEIWSEEMAESGYDNWFDFATEYLNYFYVDATMVGASQPYFVHGEQFRIEEEEKLSESVEWDKVIDNDMSIKELDDTANWLYKYHRDEWDKFTDNELIELAKLCQISNENPWGRAYDDEVFDEMDRRGLSLNKTEGCKKKNKKSARNLKEATNDKITSEDLNNGVTLKCNIDGKEHIIYASWDINFDFDEEVKSGNIPKRSNPEDWGGIIFEVNAVGEEYIDGGELVTNKDEFTATSLGSDLLDLIGSNGTDFELTSEVPKEEPKEKKPEGKTITTEDLDSEGINYIFRGDVGNGDERLFINFALSSEGGIDYTIYREGGSEVDGGVMDVDTTKTWSSMDEVAKELVSFQGIKDAYSFIACDDGSADETLSQYGFINEAVREIKPRDRFDYGNNIKGDNYFLSYKTYKADPNSISFRKDGSVSVYAKYRTPDGKIREVMPTFEPGTTEEDLKKFADMLCKNGWNKTKKIINKKVNEAVTESEPENATKPNKPNKVRNYLNYELEDDDTETGGVSFNGETVADFIGDADISEDDDLDTLNSALVSCGIRPIAEGYLTDYRGDDYWDLSDAYVNGSIDDKELAWELIKMFDSYDAAERAFKEITDGKKMPSFGEDFEDIKEITPDEANQLIGEWNSERMSVAKGRYLAQDGESKFIAIDNRTGDCWVEEFSNKGSAISWLEDKEEVNESLKEEVRTDQEEGFEIDDELAKQCDRLSYKGINTRYDWETNTLIFSYANEFLKEDDDLDTIIYRNETPEQIKDYIDKQLIPYLPMGERALKELVNKGVLQSVKSKKNSDNTVEYLIAYEIPMSVGSTDRVITADDSSLEALVRATKESANELGDDIYGSLTDENDFYGYDTKEEMEERIDDEKAILDNIATDLENMLGSSNMNEAVSSKNPAVDSLVKLFNKKRKSSIDIYNVVGDYDLDLEYDFTLEDIEKEESQIELGRPNSKDDINRDLNAMIIRVLDYVDKPTADMLRKQSKIKTSVDLNEAVDEEGNFTTTYLINGGEYALSKLERTPVGGEVDLLVRAKDGKGNSAILPGYDQVEGFEFTEEDEPFYSGTSAGSEDIAKLFKKFKPDVEVTSIKRLLDDGTVDEEAYTNDEYTFKPGYHEWILAKNGETIATYSSSTIDEIPGTSHKEIKDYVTGMVDMDDELDGYNKQDIIEVMTRVLYSYYGDLNESADIYDSVMIDANDLEPIPVCFNLYKPMKVEDIIEYIRNNDYELDEIGQEVSEKELKGRTFRCNLELNESTEDDEEWERLGKIADKIHAEFMKSEDKSEEALRKICDKYNMDLEGYLFVDGYYTFEELVDDVSNLNESSEILTESRPDKEAAKAKIFRDSRRRLGLPKEGIKSKEQVLQYLKKCKDDVDVMNVNDRISGDVLRNAMLDLGFNFKKETGLEPSSSPEEFIKYMEDGVQKLNESDTGYDYWGPKSMERFDGPAFIQYYGGPGNMEYLQRARNGRYVWVNSANIGDPYTFDSYEDALEVQKQFGGEIIDYNREYLGKDDTDEE